MTAIETLKSQAKRLRTHLSEIDISLTHSQVLEAVAVMHGHRDWNTASAALSHQAAPTHELQEPLVLCVTVRSRRMNCVKWQKKCFLLHLPEFASVLTRTSPFRRFEVLGR